MTLFENLAAEQYDERQAARRALILAKTRVEDSFGPFLRQASTIEDVDLRVAMISDELKPVIAKAFTECGLDPDDTFRGVYDSIVESYFPQEHKARTASIQTESRKPKMCPYHSEVTSISLAQGEPRAGFDSMAQHAWGPKHCQGDEYGGDRCNFKPEMTTQSYWDDKATRAEERKQERAEQAEVNTESDLTDEVPNDVEPEINDADIETDVVDNTDNVIEVDFAQNPEPAGEEPIAVAASTKVADQDVTGLDGPSPKMDKRLWTPERVKHIDADDDNGRWPTKTVDPVVPIVPQNADTLTEIGEETTERVDLPSSDNAGFSGGGQTGKGGTFPSGKHAEPVTSSFVPQSVIDAAL